MNESKSRVLFGMINSLDDGEIFVFGSNLSGIHGAGAAKSALGWGAQYGTPVGLQGRTYAIPTKDEYIETLSVDEIKIFVDEFVRFAKSRKDLVFLVTEIGCGLSGYKPNEIAPLFIDAMGIENIRLPFSFWSVLVPAQFYFHTNKDEMYFSISDIIHSKNILKINKENGVKYGFDIGTDIVNFLNNKYYYRSLA